MSIVAAAPSPSRSPGTLLYRHVLEVTFSFLAGLREINAAQLVCKEWRAAVLSMPCPLIVVRLSAPIAIVCASPLARLIGQITNFFMHPLVDLQAGAIPLMKQHMPNLRVFQCTLRLPPTPLAFPSALRELLIHVAAPASIEAIHALISSLTHLPHLVDLTLRLPRPHSDLRLAPLAAVPSLQSLYVLYQAREHTPSDESVADMRALASIPTTIVQGMGSALDRIAAKDPPQPFQWIRLGFVAELALIDRASSQVLPLFPCLATLVCLVRCPHLDWLSAIPTLTALDMRLDECPADAAVQHRGLLLCSEKLEELSLFATTMDSDQLSECLQRLPLLRRLNLLYARQLLRCTFLARASPTLKDLSMSGCYNLSAAAAETAIIFTRRWNLLRIHQCFSTDLDEATIQSFRDCCKQFDFKPVTSRR